MAISNVTLMGASRGSPGHAASGGIFRDSFGVFRGCFSFFIGIKSAVHAELCIAMVAIEQASLVG